MRRVAWASFVLCLLAACGKEYATGEDAPDAGNVGAGVLDSGTVSPADSSTADRTVTPVDASKQDDATADAGIDADAAPPRCDLDASFGAPLKIPGLNVIFYTSITLTKDELTAVITAPEENGDGARDLFITQRASLDAPFAKPLSLKNLNTPNVSETGATLSADGLRLSFVRSEEDDAGHVDFKRLLETKRGSQGEEFPAAAPIPSLSEVYGDSPSYGPDQTFYFAEFVGAGVRFDFYSAAMFPDGGLGPRKAILPLNSPNFENGIAITGDGLTVYFGSNRTSPTDPLNFDYYEIYRATRARTTDPWSNVTPVTELNYTGSLDVPSWVSPDGCHLYMTSGRPGINNYSYMASKPPAP